MRALWILIMAAGCGGGNGLSGSISEQLSLDYTYVRLRAQDNFVVVDYVRTEPDLNEKPCKLTINVADLPGVPVEISEDAFAERVALTRAMIMPSMFPPVARGTVTFSDLDSSSVGAHFAITFDSGRTLNGHFSGALEP